MPKVICTLENASDNINGVKFTLVEGVGRVSEDLSDEDTELFASIPGYEIVEGEIKPVVQAPAPKAAKAPKKPSAPAPAPIESQPEAPAPGGEDDTTF